MYIKIHFPQADNQFTVYEYTNFTPGIFLSWKRKFAVKHSKQFVGIVRSSGCR